MKLTDVYNPSSNRRTLIYTQFYTAHNRRTPTLTFKPQSRKSRKTHRHKITRLKNSILPAAEYQKNCQNWTNLSKFHPRGLELLKPNHDTVQHQEIDDRNIGTTRFIIFTLIVTGFRFTTKVAQQKHRRA